MTDKALKGNKLTKKFNLNLTSSETPKHVKDKKRLEIMYKNALDRRAMRGRGKK